MTPNLWYNDFSQNPKRKDKEMTDHFKRTLRGDFWYRDPDLYGVGHPEQRNAFRKKQRRRVRRVLKQELKKELGY